MRKTLLERLLEAGYPKAEVHHHVSDLYIFVTPLTTKIVKEWCADNQFNMDWFCPKFVDQITGKMMYDCAFQYYEVEEND